MSLALETAWTSKSTIQQLVSKAHRNAYMLALEKNIITKETISQILAKAHASMLSVSSQVKPVSSQGEKTPT